MTVTPSYLKSLNSAQLKAVLHPVHMPLRVIAGPGTGKTKVLTSRIAHLINHHSISPHQICAVTFTRRAADEMRNRLNLLIGRQQTSEVMMGTFHSICLNLLMRNANSVGLKNNFTVCDRSSTLDFLSYVLPPYKKKLARSPNSILDWISRTKAKGMTPDMYLDPETAVLCRVYDDYQSVLRRYNAVDYDDILTFSAKLFEENTLATQWCQHVLVDEFQDTSSIQFKLMKSLVPSECVTVVGDPDQSIFGWHAADHENWTSMENHFTTLKLEEAIFLEKNYRSTGSILALSQSIISQDKKRTAKKLEATQPFGFYPILSSFESTMNEADFLAAEIKRLMMESNGLLSWGDFCVLLRLNASSRAIEAAFRKEGIPFRNINREKSFFERTEIRELLAYLHLADNPKFAPAFIPATKTQEGIGKVTRGLISQRADAAGLAPMEYLEWLVDGGIYTTNGQRDGELRRPFTAIQRFVTTVRDLRFEANRGSSMTNIIRRLRDLIDHEEYLGRKHPKYREAILNVRELLNYASMFDEQPEDISPSEIVGNEDVPDTCLRAFLRYVQTSAHIDDVIKAMNRGKGEVTISTCHAAKGLQWPVVMVAGVANGTIPLGPGDINEERRVLYVACTRAQALLYLTYGKQRMNYGVIELQEASEFVSGLLDDNMGLPPMISSADWTVLAKVLGRDTPGKSDGSTGARKSVRKSPRLGRRMFFHVLGKLRIK